MFSPVAALSLPPERASPLKMEEMGRRELTTPREKKEKVSPPASPHFRLGLSVNSVSPYTETFLVGKPGGVPDQVISSLSITKKVLNSYWRPGFLCRYVGPKELASRREKGEFSSPPILAPKTAEEKEKEK